MTTANTSATEAEVNEPRVVAVTVEPAVAEIADFLRSIRGPVCEIETDKRSRALDEILNETR